MFNKRRTIPKEEYKVIFVWFYYNSQTNPPILTNLLLNTYNAWTKVHWRVGLRLSSPLRRNKLTKQTKTEIFLVFLSLSREDLSSTPRPDCIWFSFRSCFILLVVTLCRSCRSFSIFLGNRPWTINGRVRADSSYRPKIRWSHASDVVTSWSDLVAALNLNPLTRFDLNILYIYINMEEIRVRIQVSNRFSLVSR